VKKIINGCLIQVRKLPLECSHVPGIGRKWKNIARHLQSLLLYLATFANGDGTFNRDDQDYSPSVKTQATRLGFSRRWIYRLQDYLRSLGFLSWTRRNRQEGRKYTITIPDVNDSPISEVKDSDSEVNDTTSEVNDRNPEVKDRNPEVNYTQPLKSSTSGPSDSYVKKSSLPSLPSLDTVQPTVKAAEAILEDAVKWVKRVFEDTTRKILPQADARELFAGRLPEAVKGTVEDWLEKRDLTGLNNPALFLKREFADHYKPTNRPNQEEYSREWLAEFQANLDRQHEQERERLAAVTHRPEKVPDPENYLPQ
jgi:hypothetical protein